MTHCPTRQRVFNESEADADMCGQHYGRVAGVLIFGYVAKLAVTAGGASVSAKRLSIEIFSTSAGAAQA
jgi:hypothetical protein